ncbi:MAG: methyltransferase domain-containing protein [Verrucomicrobium sp.]
MRVCFDHRQNVDSLEGAQAALAVLFESRLPSSLLDIGCGSGSWLAAASGLGITDAWGMDGIDPPPDSMLPPSSTFKRQDLALPWDLGRRFDAALCLEVAEHLPAAAAHRLVAAIARHTRLVYFSAACPGQEGQHHIHCQWPAYWQSLFNGHGFVCDDRTRWKIWEDERIAWWYRQNLFSAHWEPDLAGREPRIAPAVHPGMLAYATNRASSLEFAAQVTRIEDGAMPLQWYAMTPLRAIIGKLKRFRQSADRT